MNRLARLWLFIREGGEFLGNHKKTEGDEWSAHVRALAEKLESCEMAFRAAARRAQDTDLHFLFVSCCFQRRNFASALWEILGHPITAEQDESGTLAGTIKDGVAEIKAHLGGSNSRKLLRDIVNGEHSLLTAYKRTLDAPLPETARRRIASQFEEVEATHSRLVEIEKMSAKA